MTTATPTVDPLEAHESLPAVSFHAPNGGRAIGEWAMLEVREWPELIQQRDDDGNPEFWDAKEGEAPQPKLVLVVPVYDGVDEKGNKVAKNLWAKKMGKKWPESLFQQLIAAQRELKAATGDAERRLRPGDTLAVQYYADDTSKPKVKGNYPKKYKAKIKPGELPAAPPADALADTGSDDPWSDAPAIPAAAAPAADNSGFGAGRTQPGGDPFGAAAPDDGDEPPF